MNTKYRILKQKDDGTWKSAMHEIASQRGKGFADDTLKSYRKMQGWADELEADLGWVTKLQAYESVN